MLERVGMIYILYTLPLFLANYFAMKTIFE